MRTRDLKSFCLYLFGPPGPNKKRHVAVRFGQAPAKVTADSSGTDHQNLHR
jgi:hypothetical protein